MDWARGCNNYIYINNRTPKYTKQILIELKTEIESNITISGDLNSPLSAMGRLSRTEN